MLKQNNKSSLEERSKFCFLACVPNHTGTHKRIKKIGIKNKKKNINSINKKKEREESMLKNKSLAVKSDVPGKPIVTSMVTKEASHSRGKLPATPDIKKKSRVWYLL
jgi:hypothetical protein